MTQSMLRRISVSGIVALLTLAGTANAQWNSPGRICVPVQVTVQQCYQTVPVTEYRPVKQTVKRPVIETKYVDRQVTVYRQVTENKVVDVPVVNYQNVTEYRTSQRDRGRWVTQYHQRPQISPWQYDPRPNLWGWLNRSGYAVRTALAPRYATSRYYVPNVETKMIPVTRTVAVHETRKMTYQVTRLVPQTITRKVAVNTVRYVDQEITTMRPVTVMRAVPIGSRVSYSNAPIFGGPSRTALVPYVDPIGGSPSPNRSANRRSTLPRSNGSGLKRESNNSRSSGIKGTSLDRSTITIPQRRRSFGEGFPQAQHNTLRSRAAKHWNIVPVPSVVLVSRWVARHVSTAGPTLTPPTVSVADAVQ